MKWTAIVGDPELELNGRWFTYDPYDETPAEFLIARANNDNYKRRFHELLEPHIALVRANKLETKVSTELGLQATAETILLGWRNVTNEDGSPLEPTAENRLMLLKSSMALRDFVWARAADAEHYRQQTVEEASGN